MVSIAFICGNLLDRVIQNDWEKDKQQYIAAMDLIRK